jgi:hypothetical protein
MHVRCHHSEHIVHVRERLPQIHSREAGIQPLAPHAASTWRGTRFVLLGLLAYTAAALAIGDELLPGGQAFALLSVWTGAHVGSQILRLIKLPPLVGMLVSGIVMINAGREWVAPLPADWGSKLRASALAVILMRCDASHM